MPGGITERSPLSCGAGVVLQCPPARPPEATRSVELRATVAMRAWPRGGHIVVSAVPEPDPIFGFGGALGSCHGDGDLASGMSRFEVVYRLRQSINRKGFVESWSNLAALEQSLDDL